jgi:hypothetical protein
LGGTNPTNRSADDNIDSEVWFDVQGGISTMCYLPGQNTPERECWCINMGAVDKDFCSTKAMAAATA